MHASINVDRELLVSIQLLKGKFDDTLPWPFSYNITISLLEEETDCPRNSRAIILQRIAIKSAFKNQGKSLMKRLGSII